MRAYKSQAWSHREPAGKQLSCMFVGEKLDRQAVVMPHGETGK